MHIGQMKFLLGTTALLVCVAAHPQTSSSTTTDHPTPIGTSQQKADAANAAAVKRGDTATVVRTGPTVADKAESAGATTKAKAKSLKHKAKSTANSADATTSR